MIEFNLIEEVHKEIFSGKSYDSITNKICVFKSGEKYFFAKKALPGWILLYHYSVVRAVNLFYKLQLFSSEFYDIFISKHELEIRLNENGLKEKDKFIKDKWKVIVESIIKFRLRLYCKMEIDEKFENEDDVFPKLKSLSYRFYPGLNANGFYLPVYTSYNKMLVEIKEFALLNQIKIKLGYDELCLFANKKVIEKNLNWEDFLFGYHTGICFIIKERKKISSPYEGKYIKKVPEIFTGYPNFEGGLNKNIKLINLFEDSQDYICFGSLDEWKESILQFITENNKLEEFNLAEYKAIDELREKESKYNNSSNYHPSYFYFDRLKTKTK